MPRVVGMRAEDARFALRAQGFRVRGVEETTSAKGCNVSDVHMQPYHVVRVRLAVRSASTSPAREVPPCVRDDNGQRP